MCSVYSVWTSFNASDLVFLFSSLWLVWFSRSINVYDKCLSTSTWTSTCTSTALICSALLCPGAPRAASNLNENVANTVFRHIESWRFANGCDLNLCCPLPAWHGKIKAWLMLWLRQRIAARFKIIFSLWRDLRMWRWREMPTDRSSIRLHWFCVGIRYAFGLSADLWQLQEGSEYGSG